MGRNSTSRRNGDDDQAGDETRDDQAQDTAQDSTDTGHIELAESVGPNLPGVALSPVTREQALAATGSKDGNGSDVSDAQREQTADLIETAARQHMAWRAQLPVEQQIAMLNVPVIAVPGEAS